MVAEAGVGRSGAPWIVPDGLLSAELDRDTGLLADATTPAERRYTEYFLAGTEPLSLRLDTWQLFRGDPPSAR